MGLQRNVLLLMAVALLFGAAAYLTCFTVKENEYVIITQFGKTVRTLDEPGLYFKKPGFLQTVNRLDKRLHIFKTLPITLLLHDKNPIIVASMICLKIQEPERFFRRVKTLENAYQKIGDMINSQLGSVLGSYDLDNIINVDAEKVKLAEIEDRVLENTAAQARAEYGIDIVRMGIRRLAYPAIVEQSVYSRMRAEREKEAKKYRAEGREEADKIEGETDKEVKRILAEAYRDAEITRGNGDREAMGIYAKAYGEDQEFYTFLKSLELYRETLRENTTLILSTESELFRYLDYKVRPSDGKESEGEGDAAAPAGGGR